VALGVVGDALAAGAWAGEELLAPVRLGATSAFRYKDLQVSGLPSRLTLMVAPTTSGVLGVLCIAGPRSSNVPTYCEDAADTLHLNGSRPLPLGPSLAYAHRLAGAIGQLDRAYRTEQALAGAKTRTGQAHNSQLLSRYFSSAAATLAQARPGPDNAASNTTLLGALLAAARGFAAMSRAAHAGDSPGFRDASRKELSAQTTMREALAALVAAGYP